ncbi:hypothetical protein BDF22DRAFT_667232 [Syncephalis plumigaleata]|nr:hypothetical protein BDF22DRAFT_667232 [Syncephalis plumigaleata]
MTAAEVTAANANTESLEATSNDGDVAAKSTPSEMLASLNCPPSPLLMPSEWESLDRDELRRLLAESHYIIRERERELTLAAEIGRNLVAENGELKQRCQDISKQMRQRSITRSNTPRRSPTPRRAGPHISVAGSPSITPVSEVDEDRAISPMSFAGPTSNLMSTLLSPNDYSSNGQLVSASAVDDAIAGSVITVTQDGGDYSRPQSPVRPTPRRAFGARTPATGRQESDIISDLERQMSELQGRLDQAYAEAEQTRKASARRAKKAEQELASTRRELERAHERIVELEEAIPGANGGKHLRSRLMRRSHTTNGSGAGDGNDSDMSDPDATDLNELDAKALRRRVQDLEASHAALAATKRIVNERLAHAQQELRTARQRNQELESRLRTQQHLEEEYEQQSAHMMQLERALDEQRRYARGDFSPAMAPAAALQPRSPDLTAEGLRRRGKNLMDEFERGRSLMDEFEMVLFRGTDSQMQQHEQAMDGSGNGGNNSNNGGSGNHDYQYQYQDPNGELSHMGPTGVDTLFNALAGAARAGADGTPLGGFMLDELVGAVGQATFGPGDQMIKVEDRSFFGLLRGFLMSVWRWFRFLCVLWCAVVVSVYRGPPKEITSA